VDISDLSSPDWHTHLDHLQFEYPRFVDTAFNDNGYLEIIKDEVKNNSTYYMFYAEQVIKECREYFRIELEKIYGQDEKAAYAEFANKAEGLEKLTYALYALGFFFLLTFILLAVKIERNLRR